MLDEMDRVSYGGPWRPLAEELGDLLFQIVFHAQLAHGAGRVRHGRRVPPPSPTSSSAGTRTSSARSAAAGAEQVLQNWAKLKAEERKEKHGHHGSVLDGVPGGAPALQRAERLTEKASRIGFDWPDLAGVRAKVDEELQELDEAIASKDRDAIEHELGDVLFSLANLGRWLETPAGGRAAAGEPALHRALPRVERAAEEQGVPFGEATLEQMDALWDEAKREQAKP